MPGNAAEKAMGRTYRGHVWVRMCVCAESMAHVMAEGLASRLGEDGHGPADSSGRRSPRPERAKAVDEKQ